VAEITISLLTPIKRPNSCRIRDFDLVGNPIIPRQSTPPRYRHGTSYDVILSWRTTIISRCVSRGTFVVCKCYCCGQAVIWVLAKRASGNPADIIPHHHPCVDLCNSSGSLRGNIVCQPYSNNRECNIYVYKNSAWTYLGG